MGPPVGMLWQAGQRQVSGGMFFEAWPLVPLFFFLQVLCEPLMFMSTPTLQRPVAEPLRPGGEQQRVTEENKHEYLQLLAEHYLMGGIRVQLQAVVRGFHEVIPLALVQELDCGPRDLQLLLTGPAPFQFVRCWCAEGDRVRTPPLDCERAHWAAVGLRMGPDSCCVGKAANDPPPPPALSGKW